MASLPGASLPEVISEEFLRCKICLENYKSPKILPCLHTFCQACLDYYIRKNNVSSKFLCPLCRCETLLPKQGVAGFKSNFFLVSLQDVISARRPGEKACTYCSQIDGKDQVAVVRCMVCHDYLCIKCCEAHRRTKQTRDHRLVTLMELQNEKLEDFHSSQPVYCGIHELEPLKFYCTGCDIPICRDCRLTVHFEHQCADLHDAAKYHRDRVRTILENVQTKVFHTDMVVKNMRTYEKTITSKKDLVVNEIQKHSTYLHAVIDDYSKKLTEELTKIVAAEQKQIDANRDIVETTLISLRSTCDFADKLVSHGRDAEIISMKSQLEERLMALAQTPNIAHDIPSKVEIQFLQGKVLVDDVKKIFGNTIVEKQPIAGAPSTPQHNQSMQSGQGLLQTITPGSPITPTSPNGGFMRQTPDRRSFGPGFTSTPPLATSTQISPGSVAPSSVSTITGSQQSLMSSVSQQLANTHLRPAPMNVQITPGQLLTSAQLENAKLSGISITANDDLILIDRERKEVIMLDRDFQLIGTLGTSGDGLLLNPSDIAVMNNGYIAVSDANAKAVKIYSTDGVLTKTIREGLEIPTGLAVNSRNELIVVDRETGFVNIYSMDGSLLHTIQDDLGKPLFKRPLYVATNINDDIIVSDFDSHCIKVFDRSCRFLFKYGSPGAGDNQFWGVHGLSTDMYGHILAADCNNSRVHILSPDGQLKSHVVTKQDGIEKPIAIDINVEGQLVVCEWSGKISVFKYLQ